MRPCLSTIGASHVPWPACLDAVAAAGFDRVEILAIERWAHLDARRTDAADARRELAARRLTPVALHGGGLDGNGDEALARSLAYARAALALAAAIDCPLINLNGMPVAAGTTAADRAAMIARIAGALRALVPEARARGVRVTLENHHRFHLETVADWRAVFAAVGEDAWLGATIDTWHCAASGVDPATAARDLGARVFHVHVKDIADPTAAAQHRALVAALASARYAGDLSAEVEVHDARARDAAVAGARAYLDSLAATANGARA